ncbi:MAG: helix-turn-helix domain-containing protein [Acetobacteraceae bacterium]
MSDRVLIPLSDGRWLALAPEQLSQALEAGAAVMGGPQSSTQAGEAEPLMDAVQLAEALSLPTTWIEQAAREGRIPSVQAGRWRRFRRSAVEEALASRSGAAGRA